MNLWQPRQVDALNHSRERWLLLLAFVFVAFNRVTLMLTYDQPFLALWPVAAWAGCVVLSHLALNWLAPGRDPYLLPVTLLLAGWGLTLIARLAPPFAPRQTLWLVIATGALITAAALPANLDILRRYRYSWLFAGLALLALTLVLGVNPSGNQFAPRLWLGFGRVYFQPSELLKLLMVVFLASYLAEKRTAIRTGQWKLLRWHLTPAPYLTPMLLMWGFCMVLLIWQRDLGAASLFFLIFLAMLYSATGQYGYLIAGLIMLATAFMLGYTLYGVVQLRVDTWINPWPEADNRAYQIVQSLLAVASGGLTGSGLGRGAPEFIPVVHSDFAFAAIAEEYGLLGSAAVTMLLAVLVTRALHIAINNEGERPFHALLAAGIGFSLGFQSLLIMGGVLKIIPLTGVTLPFVSYGGSSLLFSFLMLGLLLRISTPARTDENPRS